MASSSDAANTQERKALLTWIETCRDMGRSALVSEVAYLNDAAKENALDVFDRTIDHIIGRVIANEAIESGDIERLAP